MNYFRLLVALALPIAAVQAQPTSWKTELGKPNANFSQVCTEAAAYYAAHPDEVESHEWKVWQRWENFWGPRLGPNQDIESGRAAFYSAVTNLDLNPPGAIAGTWQSLGPHTMPTRYNGDFSPAAGQGMITSLNCDRITEGIIYAGSNSGGLWKTTDLGQTWVSLTDDETIVGMGVEQLLIHPADSNLLYIATGTDANERNYGVGVFKSTDGGQSWAVTPMPITPTSYEVVRRLQFAPGNPNVMDAATLTNTVQLSASEPGGRGTYFIVVESPAGRITQQVQLH